MSKFKLSYCQRGSDIPNIKTQYSTGEYTKYDGSKANPYNHILEVDTDDLTAFKAITKSYVHTSFVYEGGARSNANMLEATCLILDFDSKDRHDDWPYETWSNSEPANEFTWVCVASKSHTATEDSSNDCYHVFIPIESVITDSTVYTGVLKAFIAKYDIKSDRAALDGSRLFSPSRRSGQKVGSDYFNARRIGETLDVSQLADDIASAELQRVEDNKLFNEERVARMASNRLDMPTKLTKGELAMLGVKSARSGAIRNTNGQVKAIIVKYNGEAGTDYFLNAIVDSIVQTISVDAYEDWIKIGFLLRRYGATKDQWVTLCKNSFSYTSADDDRWDGFNVEPTYEIQPLYKLAEDNGWYISQDLAEEIINWGKVIELRHNERR